MIDTKKERGYRVMMIAFIILFFTIAYKCSAQVDVYRSPKSGKVIFYPKQPMKFNLGSNDTTVMSMIVDSGAVYKYKIFIHYPISRQAKDYSVVIGFTDGSIEKYDLSHINEEYNFCEYLVPDITRLKTLKFDYLAFAKLGSEEACLKIKTKDFFTKFLNEIR